MSKVCSLEEAIRDGVRDGATVVMGCGLESVIPFAAGYEIIRQKKRDLTLVAPISDIQFDQLVGAGCAKKIVAAWVGNVAAGLGHNFRRAVEEGIPRAIEIEEHSNFTIGLGLQAAAMGLPYLPTRTALGSDFSLQPHFQRVTCPFTGETLLAVRAIAPDVAILHVQRADSDGNAHFWGNLGVVREAAHAAKRVILTCEEIVDHEMILADPNRTLVPGFLVSHVVLAPLGSHPSPTQGYARRDDEFYFEYHRRTRSREGFEEWLEKWVFGARDHRGYLELLGRERREKLIPGKELCSPAVSFSV
ncbi:MAG TPA: CoA-transferase [candidate division Zixibacteria bacterium]|nr:CoA-transferase [candidate division Zixibacteria bacterium]